MKKNLTTLLHKGNLTPKERFLLLIQSGFMGYKTGKEPLTEADRNALQNWQAKDNSEVREWNKYNESTKLASQVEVQAKLTYLETKAEHYRKKIIDTELGLYPFYREHINDLNQLKKIKPVDIKEAVELADKQREQKLKDGLAFEDAVYNLAFESLSEDLRKDILALDGEAETDRDYLDDEEIIADLFNGKDTLTKEAKEKLAELISERAIKQGLTDDFAELPIFELAKKWAEEKNIKIPKEYKEHEGRKEIIKKIAKERKEDEDKVREDLFYEEKIEGILETYAKDNKTTLKAILKETCLEWLNEGLFIDDEYSPIFNSDSKETINKIDTKLPHKEVLKGWLKAKDQARATLQGLIDKGELKTQDKTRQGRTLTGESLYNFKGDYKFIKDFKKRVDEYDAGLGGELLICERDEKGEAKFNSIFGKAIDTLENHFKTTNYFKETEKNGEIFLEFKDEEIRASFKEMRESLIKGYATLLAYRDIYKRLSKTYETDLTFILNNLVENVSEYIDQHNIMLGSATEGMLFFSYKTHLKMQDDLTINKDKILPDIDTSESWSRKFEEILADDF